jgi:hypothetical protein
MKYILACLLSLTSTAFGAEEPTIKSVLRNGVSVVLKDASQDYGQAGLYLREAKVDGFGKCDLCYFDGKIFIPFYSGPQSGQTQFTDADLPDGGIAGTYSSDGKHIKCVPTFYKHYVSSSDLSITPKKVYCVKTRDGKEYAFVRIDEITEAGLVITIETTKKGLPILRTVPSEVSENLEVPTLR